MSEWSKQTECSVSGTVLSNTNIWHALKTISMTNKLVMSTVRAVNLWLCS